MKAHHLLFQNSIDINPRMGTIKLNDKRMALISVEALGYLRRDLVATLGMERAKGFLLRYGFASGYNDAESIESMYNWESKRELILAGPALHTLEGIVTVEPDVLDLDGERLYMSGYWRYSFEGEEHIRHFSYSNEAVCWMLVGFATGYLTKIVGKEIVIYEKSCIGKGDEKCYFVAQTVEHCAPEHRDILRYYEEESLVTELDKMYNEVKTLNLSIIRSEKVHKELTSLLLEGKNLSTLIDVIADVLGKSVIIKRGEMNQAFESKFLTEEDYDRYQKWMRKENVQSNDFIHIFKIMANKDCLGKMIVLGTEPITKEDRMIIERALSVLSIQMYTQRMIAQSLWQKKVDFFDELLNDSYDKEQLIYQANHLFNFDIEKNNRIVVIKSISEEKNKDIWYLLNTTYPKLDIFMKKGYIIMILPKNVEEKSSLHQFLHEVQRLVEKTFSNTMFYIGAGKASASISEIGESYKGAFQICDFLRLAYPTKNKIAIYEQLDPIMLFLKSMEPKELLTFSEKTIGNLLDYDKNNESNLVQTLKSYLDNNGNLNQTATELNLSIPGLRYRLNKIHSLCEVDFKTGQGSFHCQIAIQTYYTMKAINNHSFKNEKIN
ncbi:XylR N-terminal domain-containing protein [Halalkalibacterium ligniniphilum]|uniref:XylR N-terminal domain-containing protein n=1 Tax=Halalkalibacterium ligniniphilum TaxID=1134413 RepID=UPI000346D298|nr:XylR N-terminal domain-containing protein [Halalkalibacterium ligniniphilum]